MFFGDPMFWNKVKNSQCLPLLFLTLVAGLVYLPRLGELSFVKDDWYFIYDGFMVGPQVFLDVTRHTRPIRGPLYQLLFSLFGINPTPYHFLLFVWRLLGGLGAFWLFNMLWPKQRHTNLFLALLVIIYPGFLWWTGGFEFQPYVLSFSLAIFSIAFTLKALQSPSKGDSFLWAGLAFLTGWIYLALVEFAIGMEIFRLLCIYLLISHKNSFQNVRQRLTATARASAIFLVIPISFVIWYQFFFENWRSAQDAGTQLSQLFASPLTGLWAGIRLLQSSLNVLFFAWVTPLQQNFFNNRLRDLVLGMVAGALVIFLTYLFGKHFLHSGEEEKKPENDTTLTWQNEAFWVGLLGLLGAILPVVLVNRNISFDRLSHYALPGSLAGVVMMGAIVFSLIPSRTRWLALSLLVGIATLTHHGVAAHAVNDAQELREFWWQVTWRAPSIRTQNDTTLVVLYPGINYLDGDEVAWAPANIIYYPEKQKTTPVHVPLAATRLEPDALNNIFWGTRTYEKEDLIIKYTTFTQSYKNLLLLTQSREEACVRVIDNRWPDVSTADGAFVMVGASKSRIGNIKTNAEAPVPPEVLFGAEPPHGWCYYYQKADLARQQGDWGKIAEINQIVHDQGLHPNDQIEWMPFLQAYAYLGDAKAVKQISTRINTEPFYRQQACQIVDKMDEHGYPLAPEMQGYVKSLFCGGDQ
jgi:hypothetical protein